MKYSLIVILLLACYFNSVAQSAFSSLAKSYAVCGDYEKAIEYETKNLEMIESIQGKNNPTYATSLNNLGVFNASLCNYQEAIRLSTLAMEIYKKVWGEKHSDYATSLSNLADYNINLGNYQEAIRLGTITMEIEKEILGDKHPDYGKSLSKLAEYNSYLGNYHEAIRLGTIAMEIYKEVLGEKHPNYAISLNNLAGYNSRLEDFQEAIRLGTIAMEIYKEVLGEKHPNYAISLNNLAGYNSDLGNYQEAIRLGTQAMEIRKKVLGEKHPDYVSSLNNLATYNSNLGNYQEAVRLGTIALEINKEVLGEKHPDYVLSLNNLALCNSQLGNYQEAIRLGTQAMEIRKKVLGEKHPDYAASLNNLATYNSQLGNYHEAIRLGTIAKEIYKESLGDKNPSYATSLGNLACYNSQLGNYQEAIRLGTLAMEIRKESLGDKHPDYAASLNTLAYYNSSIHNHGEAVRLGTIAMKIRKEMLGDKHPSYAKSLGNLALYNFRLGNYEEAVRLATLSMGIQKEVLGDMHPEYTTSLNNLAAYNSKLGNYHETIRLGTIAREIYKETLGEKHPHFILNSFGLSAYYFKINEGNKFESTMLNIFPTLIHEIKSNFTFLPTTQRQLFWNENKYPFIIIHTLIDAYPDKEFIKWGYNSLLFSKGILLNSEQEFIKFISETKSKNLYTKYNDIRNLRFQLNKLYEKPIFERYINTDSLERHIIELERLLMQESTEFGDYTKGLSVTMSDVKDKLDRNDAAIEFVEFPTRNDSTIYAAYILRKDWDIPKMVRLLEKKELNIIPTEDLYTKNEGSNFIWGKLAPYLDGVDNVYFAPDGELHQIAIEYFPDFQGEGRISDRWNLHRLSSTRELALGRKNSQSKDAVIYGGIRYDTYAESMATESRKFSKKEYRGYVPNYNVADSLSLRAGVVNLKHTLEEVENINEMMLNIGISSSLISGKEATEESFKNLSGSKKRILHVATHGFYWTETDADNVTRKNDRLMFMIEMEGGGFSNVEDKALTRTGLLMAGANNVLQGKKLPEDVDDGILTAQEIANLDLLGTDLVVLSACQTGMGDISSDGVFGLQRGFKKAGVNSILMSLWDVDDEATKILMTEFYKNYLNGMSKYESLLTAQKTVRDVPGFEDPEYWAAFILLDGLE